MLPEHCKKMLMDAAASKDLDHIQSAIDMVRILAPANFLQTEQDMRSRVFYGRPEGRNWSGTFRVIKIN